MTRYLISFNEGDMTFPAEELPVVARDAHEVLFAAKAAGVWVHGGGLLDHDQAVVVARDGTVSDPSYPADQRYLGGFAIVDVATREDALAWAQRFAVACRCSQEVRELMDDPDA